MCMFFSCGKRALITLRNSINSMVKISLGFYIRFPFKGVQLCKIVKFKYDFKGFFQFPCPPALLFVLYVITGSVVPPSSKVSVGCVLF